MGGMSGDGMCPGKVGLPECEGRLGGAWSVLIARIPSCSWQPSVSGGPMTRLG